MTTNAAIRAKAHHELKRHLAEHREKHPNVRSMMLCCAQYWADEADDAVHSHVIASERATPIWPHPCDVSYDEDEREAMPGETCWSCQDELGYLEGWDSNGSAIAGFEEFCTEDGSQEESSANNYRPYAIARVREGSEDIDIEIVGVRYRLGAEFISAPKQHAAVMTWPDPRAEDLFLQVCANARDDGPREVLRDHLLEKGDPRGEYLALVLSGEHAAAAALLAKHRRVWLEPIARVIPEGEAIFERGFLARAQVFCDDAAISASVQGAHAWGTVESLWIHTSSTPLLDHAMIALREVGVLYPQDLGTLATAPRPWAIEALHVKLDEMTDLAQLVALTTLPKLRHLTLQGAVVGAAGLAALQRAVWWTQLERVTFLGNTRGEVPELSQLQAVPAAPTFATANHDDNDRPCNWELAIDPRTGATEIAHAGYDPTATLASLAALVQVAVPAGGPIRWRATRTWTPTEADVATVSASAGRTVTL